MKEWERVQIKTVQTESHMSQICHFISFSLSTSGTEGYQREDCVSINTAGYASHTV